MTMPTDEHKAAESAFRRQVTFRIGPEDAPLLELAARVHGGLQAGILAALRAHAADRLRESPAREREPDEANEPPAESDAEAATAREPAVLAFDQGEDNLVELNVGEASSILGISAAILRGQIKRGTASGRVGENGLYLASLPRATVLESGAGLTLRGAAEVLGLKPSTIRSRCKAGLYANARNDGLGWTIPAGDVL